VSSFRGSLHKLDSNKKLLTHLKGFRDQRLVHHDSVVSGDTSLPYGEVKRLIDDVIEIYNALSRGHERSVTSFDRISRDAEQHTSEVIRIMCEDRDRARKESQKLIRRAKKAG